MSELEDALAAEHANIATIAADATTIGNAVTDLVTKISALEAGSVTPDQVAEIQADAVALSTAHDAFTAAVANAAAATGTGGTTSP